MVRPQLLVCLGLLCGAGCSDGTPPPQAADLAPAPDLLAPPSDLTDCSDAAGERARGGTCLRSVSGQVVDDGGAPVAGLTVTTCAELCFYGKTGPDGRFTVAIDTYLRVERYALLLHAQPRYAAYYLTLPAPVAGRVVIPKPLVLLPMPTDGPAFLRDGTAQTLRAAPVTLTLDAGTDTFFSPEDAAAGAVGLRLRPLRVTTPERVPFLDGLVPPALLVAFGPFEVAFGKPARLQLDNVAGLPAGAAVEWLAPRSLLAQPPPGGLVEVISQGKVSADGAHIDMDGTVTSLTWILVRRKGT